MRELKRQKTDRIEILVEIDGGQITIGEKRNLLLKKAAGDYIAFIDDDDMVAKDYVTRILEALKAKPDCCSLEGRLLRLNQTFTFFHSIIYDSWFEKNGIYYRTPNHLNTVKRELALHVGFPEKNHGEDMSYSERLQPFLLSETFIKGILYYYIKDPSWVNHKNLQEFKYA